MILLLSAMLVSLVDGHGMMTSPRSRNWLSTAQQDGVNSATAGEPGAEYCTHCLNVNNPAEGSCGQSPYHNYNTWLDSTGLPMPFTPQDTYTEGGNITISSYMDTHHNGHVEVRYCNAAPGQSGYNTPECFDGNTLTFVEDIGVWNDAGQLREAVGDWMKMPPDGSHLERGYLSGGQSVGSKNTFTMVFRLPVGVVGDEILLQWKYITANSCSPGGYVEYFTGNGLPDSYWTPGLGDKICTRPCYDAGTCSSPFNDNGDRSEYEPEQFFNCGEISILPAAPTVSPVPTKTPTPDPTSAPTMSSEPTPATPQPVSPAPNAPPSGTGCCTNDFKTCTNTTAGWCSENEANCIGLCNKWWLPNGAIEGCTIRWDSCSVDSECCSPGICISGQCEISSDPTPPSPTSPPPPPTSPPPPTPPYSGDGCCSWNGSGSCDPPEQPGNDWCNEAESQCEGSCNGSWVNAAPTTASPSGSPTTASPTISPRPTKTPTTKSPSYVFEGNKCSEGAQVLSTVAALDAMEEITYTVSPYPGTSSNPYTLSVLAEGGAAGAGGSVVSEGQAYGLLTAALALADMDANDPDYEYVMEKFWGYYNGWKKMCINSLGVSSCQETKFCEHGGNNYPCLPGWKHSGDLTEVPGTGAAPDGDADAIVAMIIAVKALEGTSMTQEWQDRMNEVKDWADQSCTQFLADNTEPSPSGQHLLLKLGTCWGGWESAGNNPSYHAPGHYRMFRDFQASITSNPVRDEQWNMLIDTSYKFLQTAQCPSGDNSGLVPNWALVKENLFNTLEAYPGAFSGSGTPQYEFGSEASRTMWRVAFDAVAYPEESASQAIPFLGPLFLSLDDGFDPGNPTSVFPEDSLKACDGTVSNVFGSWIWNGFIFGPVLSALVAYSDQDMIDAACSKVATDIGTQSYYSRSWMVISTMTLNGAVAKAGELFRTDAPPGTTSATTVGTTSATTQGTTVQTTTVAPETTKTTSTTTTVATTSATTTEIDLCANVVCSAMDQCHEAGTCNASTGICSDPFKANGAGCDDGVVSTGSDMCTDGVCGGTDHCVGVTCSASDQCHDAGTCDSSSGAAICSDPPKSDGTSCDDGNPSTSNDVCTAGVCAGSTTSTTVAATTTSSTTTGLTTPGYYCDWGNGFEQPDNDYCHSSQSNCEGNCNGSWHDPNNVVTTTVANNCVAEWGECTNDHNSCCSGLTCYVQDQYYAQCKV